MGDRVRTTVVVAALVGSVAACASERTDGTTEDALRVATLQRAANEMAQPPATTGTFASSLPGVALWALHADADSGAFVEGKDAEGRVVTSLAIAFADVPASEAGVVFVPAPNLGLDFDGVRSAIQRDLQDSAAPAAGAGTLIKPANLTGSLINNEMPSSPTPLTGSATPLTTRCRIALVVTGLGAYCMLYSGGAMLVSFGTAAPVAGPIFAVCTGVVAGTVASHPCSEG